MDKNTSCNYHSELSTDGAGKNFHLPISPIPGYGCMLSQVLPEVLAFHLYTWWLGSSQEHDRAGGHLLYCFPPTYSKNKSQVSSFSLEGACPHIFYPKSYGCHPTVTQKSPSARICFGISESPGITQNKEAVLLGHISKSRDSSLWLNME